MENQLYSSYFLLFYFENKFNSFSRDEQEQVFLLLEINSGIFLWTIIHLSKHRFLAKIIKVQIFIVFVLHRLPHETLEIVEKQIIFVTFLILDMFVDISSLLCDMPSLVESMFLMS